MEEEVGCHYFLLSFSMNSSSNFLHLNRIRCTSSNLFDTPCFIIWKYLRMDYHLLIGCSKYKTNDIAKSGYFFRNYDSDSTGYCSSSDIIATSPRPPLTDSQFILRRNSLLRVNSIDSSGPTYISVWSQFDNF